jgi:hypothetical protein
MIFISSISPSWETCFTTYEYVFQARGELICVCCQALLKSASARTENISIPVDFFDGINYLY